MVPKSLAPGQTCFQLLRPTSQLPAKLSPWLSAGTFHSPSSFHLQMLSSYTVPHARKHRHPSVQNFRVTPPSDLLPPPVSSQPTGCLRLQILLLIQISTLLLAFHAQCCCSLSFPSLFPWTISEAAVPASPPPALFLLVAFRRIVSL